jgi:hypothetical protein
MKLEFYMHVQFTPAVHGYFSVMIIFYKPVQNYINYFCQFYDSFYMPVQNSISVIQFYMHM